MKQDIGLFVKQERRKYGMTQKDLAFKAGVGLRFVRDLEQGKKSVRLDKVNDVLRMFNKRVGVIEIKYEDWELDDE
jgi:y4mF family transcriptional regulator